MENGYIELNENQSVKNLENIMSSNDLFDDENDFLDYDENENYEVSGDVFEQRQTQENEDFYSKKTNKQEFSGQTKEQSLLDSVTPMQGVQAFNHLFSSISPMIYNIFAKDHKSCRDDWRMSEMDARLMLEPMEKILEQIKIAPTNPWIAFSLVVAGIYVPKTFEVRSKYKQGVPMEKKMSADKDFKNANKSNYQKIWLDKKNGILNPEHKNFEENKIKYSL